MIIFVWPLDFLCFLSSLSLCFQFNEKNIGSVFNELTIFFSSYITSGVCVVIFVFLSSNGLLWIYSLPDNTKNKKSNHQIISPVNKVNWNRGNHRAEIKLRRNERQTAKIIIHIIHIDQSIIFRQEKKNQISNFHFVWCFAWVCKICALTF